MLEDDSELEKAGDSRVYIYASCGEGEGLRVRIYTLPALHKHPTFV